MGRRPRPGAHGAAGRPLPAPLLFFTDPARTPRPWETAARLPAGAGVVFRHFGAADRLETGRRLREATHRAGVQLLVGLDVELAEQIEADGVHLPERALSAAWSLSGRRPDWLLTGAAHSPAAVRGRAICTPLCSRRSFRRAALLQSKRRWA
ncbi:thiamine phosphate synthase [Brevundimonas sp. LF-1]|uniref:thiamine phosphate synthase n=1 Tax=Brevundimonas sp. LF-1 TaxID=3126100 RepID=UPI0030E1E36D